MIKNISNLGDAALYCDFGNEVNKSINSQVIKYFKTIKEKKFEGINNLTPSYNKLIISFDCCHENFSMDIKRLEEILKLSREKILENFLNKEYFCYMTGFIAGMPFLGDLDENMRAQRLETPRVKVPKGSVALTEQFANIYTFESPGGWNILGNTPLDVFDSSKEDKPNLINPGDTVVFKEITLDQYKNYNE
jgi:inhibitor of KinA